MKKALTILMAATLALGVTLAPRSASAADPTTEELLKRIEQLEKKVAELEGKGGAATTAAPASAVAPTKASKGEIWGNLFLNYDYITSGTGKSDNTFKLDRGYIGYKAKLSDTTTAAYLMDVNTTASGTTKLNTFIKNAYIEKSNVINDASLVFGLQGTPWTGNEEAAWKYRPIYKAPSDENGILKTADFGLSLKGKFTYGDYHVMLDNGEGFGNVDVDKSLTPSLADHKKELQARVSFTPAQNWPRFSLFGKLGGREGTHDNDFGLLVNQQLGAFSYGIDGVINLTKNTAGVKTNKRLFSICGNYDFEGTPWSAYARYDNFDPSRVVSGNDKNAFIIGTAYKLDKTTRLLLANVNNKDKGAGTKINTIRATVEVGF